MGGLRTSFYWLIVVSEIETTPLRTISISEPKLSAVELPFGVSQVLSRFNQNTAGIISFHSGSSIFAQHNEKLEDNMLYFVFTRHHLYFMRKSRNMSGISCYLKQICEISLDRLVWLGQITLIGEENKVLISKALLSCSHKRNWFWIKWSVGLFAEVSTSFSLVFWNTLEHFVVGLHSSKVWPGWHNSKICMVVVKTGWVEKNNNNACCLRHRPYNATKRAVHQTTLWLTVGSARKSRWVLLNCFHTRDKLL